MADQLIINNSQGEASTYDGAIVFSSLNLSTHSPECKLSSFSQGLTLAAGSLVLEEGYVYKLRLLINVLTPNYS